MKLLGFNNTKDPLETALHAYYIIGSDAYVYGGMNVVVYKERPIEDGPIKIGVIYVNQSYDIEAEDIEDYLNIIYSQCVVRFQVRIRSESPYLSVNYDLPPNGDQDGYLDYQPYCDPYLYSGFKEQSETQTIVDNITIINLTISDHYVLIVVPDIEGYYGGFAYQNGRYAFVRQRTNPADCVIAIAHEIGHAFGGMPDLFANYPDDPVNIMNPQNPNPPEQLRKAQWDMCHKKSMNLPKKE